MLCLCTVCIQCLRRTEVGVVCPEIGVTVGCEPPCVCGGFNPGPLEGQLVLLATEPSL